MTPPKPSEPIELDRLDEILLTLYHSYQGAYGYELAIEEARTKALEWVKSLVPEKIPKEELDNVFGASGCSRCGEDHEVRDTVNSAVDKLLRPTKTPIPHSDAEIREQPQSTGETIFIIENATREKPVRIAAYTKEQMEEQTRLARIREIEDYKAYIGLNPDQERIQFYQYGEERIAQLSNTKED